MRKMQRSHFAARGFRRDLTKKLLFSLYSAMPGDLARVCKSSLIRGDWTTLTGLTINPMDYSCAHRFAEDYLLCELTSKVPPAVAGSKPELLAEVALDKFREGEAQCAATNQRLPLLDSTAFRNLYGHSTREIFIIARGKIEQALGEFCWKECSALFGFGPGATTLLSRSKSDLYNKFGPKPDTTQQNLVLSYLATGFRGYSPGHLEPAVSLWAHQLMEGGFTAPPRTDLNGFTPFRIAIGNKVTTVPKNAKTDRTIAIEPTLNMFIQKGVGSVIRRRLRRVGVDLNSQLHNQHLAYLGSVDGSLATIDLKSASDTVAKRLVELLVPAEWLHVMNMTRSHHGVLPSGEIVTYQKFSSMGNGFTFELESLIFWALSKAVIQYYNCKDRRVGIYGDDIIVSTDVASQLLDVLSVAGFTPNTKKTFIAGPFRESCGKHYFHGVDVTPFYLRKEITHAQPMFVAVNNLRRWVSRRAPGYTLGFKHWRAWMDICPRYYHRFRGPDGYGDSYFIGEFDECLPSRAEFGCFGWTVLSLHCSYEDPPRKSARVNGPPLLLKSLYRLEKGMFEGDKPRPSDDITPRRIRPRYTEKRQLVWEFPRIGIPFTS